jgi:hypothetical protein
MRLRIRIILIVCLLDLISVAQAQPLPYKNDTLPDWENPQITGINKEDPHVTLFMADEKYSNPEVVSLMVSGDSSGHPIRNRDRKIFMHPVISRKIGMISLSPVTGKQKVLEHSEKN